MGKIVELSSSSKRERSFQIKRHNKRARVEQSDHIAKLPNELLSCIISRLSLVEAARMSVLGHRWKTLWYHYHGTLEFDETDRFLARQFNTDSKAANTQTIHDKLNSNEQVLQSLKSPFFDALNLRCFNTDGFCKSSLDFYMQFAMKKRLKTFELNLFPSPIGVKGRPYKFPLEFYDWIRKPCGLDDNISSLTSIYLNGVTMYDDLIQHILLKSPLLESLRLRYAIELVNPKVIGETLKLKHLEISGIGLKSIEISAPNLLTFSTACDKVKLLIKNAPKLVELSIPVHIVQNSLESVSSYLPRIEKLTWNFSLCNFKRDISGVYQFVEQNKLRHVTWKLGHFYETYLIQLNALLEASPFLHKFTLVNQLCAQKLPRPLPTVTAKHPHQHLKVLEIHGFTGVYAENKLIEYFLNNTTSLEEIIVDIINPVKRGTPFQDESDRLKSKKRALKLKRELSPRVSLVILEEE